METYKKPDAYKNINGSTYTPINVKKNDNFIYEKLSSIYNWITTQIPKLY